MRIYLQFLLGILAAVLGWSLSQFLIVDLQPLWKKFNFTFFLEFPYLINFIILTIFLAMAMVVAEIFLSHPTRIKAGLRVLRLPLLIAIGLGLVAGFLSAGISFLLKLTPAPAFLIRLTDWLIIGLAVGLAEGLSWYLRLFLRKNLESDLVKKRLISTCSLAGLGSGVAFVVAEISGQQEVVSFMLLGGLLGIALSFLSSPSFQPVLRAGYGFEARLRPPQWSAKIKRTLTFTNNHRGTKIEEGLSIELPKTGKILVGSDLDRADIYISDLPRECARIVLEERKVWLEPCGQNGIVIKNDQVEVKPTSDPDEQDPILLRHNQILTLYTETALEYKAESNSEENLNLFPDEAVTKTTKRKYVRFAFYDRFLDPEA